uniref:Xylulose kinase-1 n=1 Tax=Tanacetum cinerariifolium TaxID=118510 RepID=A0A6L2LUH6_TANCI|nr:hypothetical protein [Tanacetum cinerariifolium]
MSTPKFAKTYNLVAFLEKPTESKGFEQIIDFLNANPIKYVLTVNPMIYTSCIKQFWATTKVKTVNEEAQIQAQVKKKRLGKDFSGKVTPLFETIMVQPQEDIDEHVTSTSNDPLLSREDRLKLTELMELCTQLQSRVLALETTKANRALEIGSLKRRVKKLEKKANKKTHKLKRLYKICSSTRVESSEDARVTLVDKTQGRNDQDMFDTSIFDDKEVVAEEVVAEEVVAEKEVSIVDPVPTTSEVVTTAGVEVSAATITSQISMDEITLAKALIDIKTSKPKAKRIVIQEPNCELAARLQEEERGELSIEEKTREDLEVLWSIVIARFKKTNPVDGMDNMIFQTLKTMFEHHVEDNIWKYQQGTAKVLNWKLFDSCGVYCVITQNMVYYLLVKKIYPFTRNILNQMWNGVRLQVNYGVEMAYDLLRLIRRQINEGYVHEWSVWIHPPDKDKAFKQET